MRTRVAAIRLATSCLDLRLGLRREVLVDVELAEGEAERAVDVVERPLLDRRSLLDAVEGRAVEGEGGVADLLAQRAGGAPEHLELEDSP